MDRVTTVKVVSVNIKQVYERIDMFKKLKKLLPYAGATLAAVLITSVLAPSSTQKFGEAVKDVVGIQGYDSTTRHSFRKPHIGSQGWGTHLNANYDSLDGKIPVVYNASSTAAHTGDTDETLLAEVTIPAGTVTATGYIEIYARWTCTSSGNVKQVFINWDDDGNADDTDGTEIMYKNSITTSNYLGTMHVVMMTAIDAQLFIPNRLSGWAVLGASGAYNTASTNMSTTDVDIKFNGKLANAGEEVELEYALVIVHP